ncbi:upstream activation factor subunit spp27-like [Prosopis cineraria]|uniref:upstream activation factor subunit spp27-like n=1 Tax=Prosopis cineraria TaxID=364024 RepID=UPI00240F04C9|nr:upstream activation factor subunit spp27-like [Prosopis cineraria]XP_054796633.1 upstream activation factor subunit spp27-like [Prosopis cineraria]
MVTDQEISQAVQSLFRDANPRRSFSTLYEVVQELQAKLGHDLTHKLDFITEQINLLSRSYPPRPQPPPPPQQARPLLQQQRPQLVFPPSKDNIVFSQNPNFQTAPPAPVTSAFQSFASHPEPVKPEAADGTGREPPCNLGTEAPKESTQTKTKRRGGPGGLNKLCGVSPELQVIVGQPALPRTEIVKQLWAYIRKNNLQDPSNKRKIICNDELRVVFETDCTDMFKMNKLLAKHIIPLEPTKQPVRKKQKADAESGTQSADSAPLSVIISDTLANFFGTTGREMLQSEVLRRIWEYIKVNQLEDPRNPMTIICDAKLREIFGCESITALGIPEVLGRHHIFRRS